MIHSLFAKLNKATTSNSNTTVNRDQRQYKQIDISPNMNRDVTYFFSFTKNKSSGGKLETPISPESGCVVPSAPPSRASTLPLP